ncbi:MAG: 5-nucleotidase [Nocardioidaceae bacterium]|nr:5-nucleotidase [Nocardioidaceae bacterium]
MNGVRTFRMLAGGLTASLLIGAFGTTAAQAKPTKPGGLTHLTATATPAAAGTYTVASSWDPAAGATKYRVAITKNGVTLASATVIAPSWSTTITSAPGTASLAVTPVAVHRKGSTSTFSFPLADVTAPQGSFTSSWTGTHATITQQTLSDDSGTVGITRTVDWGDGTSVPWTSGTTLNHTYTAIGRYLPTVTLKDAAGNSGVVAVPAIVIGDTTAPTGTFSVGPVTAWAAFTSVTVTQSALHDDFSPADHITQSVNWGDGTAPIDWTGTTSITHVYSVAGAFTPVVTITDEAHNAASPISTTPVVVSADTAAPVVKLLLPKTHKKSVKSWKTLRGKATDAPGTGVKQVSLRAVQKRGTRWYAYKAATKTWVKAATKAKAFAKAGALTMITSATHVWAGKLVGLRKGTLIYKIQATDNVGNVSAALTHKATLTKH